MTHDVLLIEPHPSGSDEFPISSLSSDPSFRLQRTSWEALQSRPTLPCAAHLMIAVAAPRAPRAVELFDWLGRQAIAVPILAVVSEMAEDAVLRSAVDASDDFAFFPDRRDEFRHRLRRLVAAGRDEVEVAHRRLTRELGLLQLIGNHPSFTRVLDQLPLIARSGCSVLITGETGTGKELVARAIHHLGRRSRFPFIALDCAAVPDHLFENEFFGHARGAFTDAHRDQKGLVAMADGGSLFLDEIDALSLPAQAKLLRFLQEHTFKPLGAERFCRADVHVIAATNRDLEEAVRRGEFRADLYFRLNVLGLHLPPLRDRGSDIDLLARHFLTTLERSTAGPHKRLSGAALRKLRLHAWPGNIRELLNIVHRAAVLCEGTHILPAHVMVPEPAVSPNPTAGFRRARASVVAAFEREYVEDVLRRHNGNVTHAAVEAQKDRRAFGRLVKKYGIQRASP